jgi:hypothetical protein
MYKNIKQLRISEAHYFVCIFAQNFLGNTKLPVFMAVTDGFNLFCMFKYAKAVQKFVDGSFLTTFHPFLVHTP